jgi:EAL domain-containing protein (putative c-di-GMP-specific phosphodiesterase class I)
MLLALQPIVHANSGRTALYECLLRMKRPDGSQDTAGVSSLSPNLSPNTRALATDMPAHA